MNQAAVRAGDLDHGENAGAILVRTIHVLERDGEALDESFVENTVFIF